MGENILFPDGRSVDIHKVIGFMYGLTESELNILHLLMTSNNKLTVEEIANKLNIAQTSISKPINILIDKGLVYKEKKIITKTRKIRLVYYVDKDKLYSKLINDLEYISKSFTSQYYSHLANKGIEIYNK
ncbi:MarR family transcriptional regulator [Acidianus sulfidivorans JP7]|uniref:TrmB family transcriptional regulator n=1 Tax=Acidianus sulfidivorans JP7 TaxID=619593 RepID=A0A2U9IJZ9_9CREN|nr:MarR family transcriptional regulator [Acidianus sulfidivorans]AWR96340.1 MarR family transcriptional regulator [Acidianus sulfidivorans JP7]